MKSTIRLRRALGRLLQGATGLAALSVSALLASGCGGKVVVDAATGGAGGASGDASGAVTAATGTGASTGSSCAPTSTGATGGGQTHVTSCIPFVEGKCPSQYQAILFLSPSTPCNYVVSVDCGPMVSDSCCYLVTEEGGGCSG